MNTESRNTKEITIAGRVMKASISKCPEPSQGTEVHMPHIPGNGVLPTFPQNSHMHPLPPLRVMSSRIHVRRVNDVRKTPDPVVKPLTARQRKTHVASSYLPCVPVVAGVVADVTRSGTQSIPPRVATQILGPRVAWRMRRGRG